MSEPDERSYLPAPLKEAPLALGAVTGISSPGAAPPLDDARDGEASQSLSLWGVVKKRKWIVLSLLLLGVAVGAITAFLSQPIYAASGKIIVRQAMTPSLAGEAGAVGTHPHERWSLGTELRVLQSRTLAKRVIDALSLEQRPEFTRCVEELPPQAVGSQPEARDSLLVDHFLSRLGAELFPESRVIEVTYESPDPKLAADIVGGVMEQLIDYTLAAQLESTKRSREWIMERLAELGPKVKQMQQDLVRYGQKNQIVEMENRPTIAMQRLTDLNRRLMEAEYDRIGAETLYRLSREADVDTFPPIMTDPLVRELRQRLTEDRTRLAELSRQFTDEWPAIKKLKGQIEESDRQLRETKNRILAKVEADYRAALAREETLGDELTKQKANILQQNELALNRSIKQQQVEANTQLYNMWLHKLNEVELSSALTGSQIQILDQAQVPLAPVRPRKVLDMSLGGLAGLLGGILLAFVWEYRDNRLKSTEDVDLQLGLPSLGIVPDRKSLQQRRRLFLPRLGKETSENRPILLLDESRRSNFADAYRSLRTAVLLSQAEAPPRSVLFTSSIPGEGKTTTAINTAISLAQTGARVMLVEGDLRKPTFRQLLKLEAQTGLSAHLTGSVDLDAIIEPNPIENLWVIPAGPLPPHPSELLSSRKMRAVVEELSRQYDFVIFDSPPASTPDALVLSRLVDGVILVVRSDGTTRKLARQAKRSLEQVKARILGVVLNQVDIRKDGFYYYYYHYYAAAEPLSPSRPD